MLEALVEARRRPAQGVISPSAGAAGAAGTSVLPWRVVHTKSRQEKALAEYLQARGVEHFLPLVPRVRYHGRRKFTSVVPLFPGYLFLRSSLEEAYQTERTDRVVRVIPVADQALLESDLAAVRFAIERGALLEPTAYLAAGVLVEVVAGPFRGLRGVIDREAPGGRLVLRVRMVGMAADFEIDRSLLEPVA